ncbi:MAG: hypothetical protein JO224_00125 [Pelomonas sp.]|nr:hypothetical protein [Roseateles sp.]
MKTHHLPIAAAIAALALPFASARADIAPNDGMRYIGVDTQADNRGNRQLLSTLSLPVGRNAWVQLGGGASRSDPADGGQRPGILTGAVGVAGDAFQFVLSTAQRYDGSRYRQSDWGSMLEWRHAGNALGLDVTHRREQASGTVAMPDGQGGTTPEPSQARVSGNGFGLHGALQLSERLNVYAAVARNHYGSSVETVGATPPGGLLSATPLLGAALLGGASVVNLDEVALDHSAQLGATYRWSQVAVSGAYTTGQVLDNAGAVRSVALKAAFDVAPGWRVTPGLGRGSSDQSGRANFATLSVAYGW